MPSAPPSPVSRLAAYRRRRDVPENSQTFSYDGFGNLLSKIGNNAPNVTDWTVNPATNQITSNGATYDANGNMSAYGPTAR